MTSSRPLTRHRLGAVQLYEGRLEVAWCDTSKGRKRAELQVMAIGASGAFEPRGVPIVVPSCELATLTDALAKATILADRERR